MTYRRFRVGINGLMAVLAVGGLAASCGRSTDAGSGGDLSVTSTRLVGDLAGPTQITWHPDGRLLIAVLGPGGEGASTGQVLAVDHSNSPGSGAADREVLVDGLDTPTGLAVVDDTLWIMERTRLVSTPLDGGELRVVRGNLPSNGRSNGTLTVTADDRLLYNTSGRTSEGAVVEGSGVLWSLDPQAPTSPDVALLVGMKHAYAVAAAGDELLVTEIGDGSFDGRRPADEVVVVPAALPLGTPVDGGWPECVGDRDPVAENGGTTTGCAQTIGPLALFQPGATPTGIALAPWDPDTAVVALWVTGEIVTLPTERGGSGPVEVSVLLSGLSGPQHLLADGDRLLVSLHGEGAIRAVTVDG